MANENQNQGGTEGRNNEFDSEKKSEFNQGQQGSTGQQGQTGGQQGQQSEFGQQGQAETNTADRSSGQSSGQSGTDRSGGFVGTEGEDSGEYLQDRDPQQAGFAEQGRGAPDDGSDIERDEERTANRSTDIEGSSENR